jgi:two-component system, NtrC family, nitrogen regulation response regulator NtrX
MTYTKRHVKILGGGTVAKAKKPIALIIDDEESICQSLAGVLEDEGMKVLTANSGRQGMIEYKASTPDVVFLDVWMPGMDGIETLQALKGIRPNTPIVIMSGHGTIETAVKTTKLGAYDFLEKPLSLEKIIPMVEQMLKLKAKKKNTNDAPPSKSTIIGKSLATIEIKKQIEMVAPRNAWVLITGENGTGKEVVASGIHKQSVRSDKPFIAVNCAAIPENLIESELFGHVKGAFTGAVADQKGKFELAHNGTLFLDEIGDMSLRTQAKILRVLQEQEFEKIGDDESIKVDVRVIAATNKDLRIEIKEGNFREDLYYRLNVIPFHMTPLRDRPGDVVLLADHFIAEMAAELKEEKKVLSPPVVDALNEYAFPGNVRELKNLCERLCIMVTETLVEVSDLPDSVLTGKKQNVGGSVSVDASATLKEAKSDFERLFILDKLQENQWNVSKTAEAIGIERSNLHRKLRTYQIDTKRLKE